MSAAKPEFRNKSVRKCFKHHSAAACRVNLNCLRIERASTKSVNFVFGTEDNCRILKVEDILRWAPGAEFPVLNGAQGEWRELRAILWRCYTFYVCRTERE